MTNNLEIKQDNAASYFIDRHLNTNIENKIAFVEAIPEAKSITYKDLSVETNKMVGLLNRNNIYREQRAIMLVLDQIEFPIIFWGCLKAGVIPVPVNTLLSIEVIISIIKDSRATTIFISSQIKSLIINALDDAKHIENIFIINEKEIPNGFMDFNYELSISKECSPILVAEDETAFWLYSSGSTGEPKGVIHVHGSLLETYETYALKVLKIKETDKVFSVAKLFFAYGLGNAMTFPMGVGATSILYPNRPTPDSVSKVLELMKPSILFAVPTIYAAMLASFTKSITFDNLRRCVSAGEALPFQVGSDWKKITGVDILDGVGSTEMLHIFLSNYPDSVEYGTSGSAVPGYELRLVDENNIEVSIGEIGELLVKGKSSSSGYWNKLYKSRTTFEGEWTRTGDKYEKISDNKYVYSGRTDDMFKVSGIWIAPFEVEQALVSHDQVIEAAVVAKADENGLEKPSAFVVLKQNTKLEGLENFLKDHVKIKIGKWKYPRWINFVDELPKTATGKIQRFKLR